MPAGLHDGRTPEKPSSDQEDGVGFLLRDNYSFGDLLASYLRARPTQARLVHVKRKQNLYMCGDSDENIYFISIGYVKTVALTRDGKGCLLGIYSSTDIVGESCLRFPVRHESAIAMTDVHAYRVPCRNFLEALDSQDMFESYLRYLTHRLHEQQQYMTLLVTCNSERRLAALLLRLAQRKRACASGWVCIDQKLTHEELAAMVGTTRSRIGFFLKKLREASLVELTSESLLTVHFDRLSSYLELPES